MADIQVANTDADLSGNTVVTEENAYTITGLHTFSRSTNAPFACISGAAYVQYLDADKLDGQEGTYYLAAANITGTTLASGVVTSSLTAVGTIATGVWNGTAVANAYVADDLTISGGTVNNSVIGGSTPAAGTFTQVDITAEGDLRLQDNTGGQYVGFDAPATVSGSYTLTLPAAIGAVDQVLSINNTDGTLQWATPDSGDITSVVAGAGMTGGGTAGDVTLNVIGTADKITVNANDVTIASTYVGQTSITTLGTVATGTWNGTAVAAAYGGTGQTSYTTGDLPYASGSTAISKLGIGTANKVLTSSGSAPQWSTQVVNAALPTNIDVGGTLDVTGATTLDGTLAVAGAVTLNDAGSDVDLRVETSGNANMLFVDGGEDRVGIGTGLPVSLLDVRGPTGTGAAPAGLLTLATNELTVVKADQLGRINFQAPLESSGSDAILASASIYAEARDTFSATVNSTDLVFSTATDAAVVEALRIRFDGDIYSDVDGPSYERGWYNYINDSTVVGFSSYIAGRYFIMIKTLGNTCYVNYYIEGVSDSTVTTFTVPFTAVNYGTANGFHTAMGFTYDNSTYHPAGRCNLYVNSDVVYLWLTYPGGTTWTASGSKIVGGQFFYQFGDAP